MEGIESLFRTAIEKKIFSGAGLALFQNGKNTNYYFGHHLYDEEARLVDERSIFDCASVTKSIPTAVIMHKLNEEEPDLTDRKVVDILDNFNTGYREEVRIRHLLCHTLDFSFSLAKEKEKSAKEILNKILNYPFSFKPGAKFLYCNTTSVVLTLVIEKLTGKNLESLAREYFFDPMEMKRTGFFPSDFADRSEILPTEQCNWRDKTIQGEVHDESAWKLRDEVLAGSAGLFSNPRDLMKFMIMCLQEGEYEGKQILKPETVARFSQNKLSDMGLYGSDGWELNQSRFMGSCSEKTFGKTGFTGSCVICDPEKDKAMVLLTNYTWPNRKENAKQINDFRAKVADLCLNSYSSE